MGKAAPGGEERARRANLREQQGPDAVAPEPPESPSPTPGAPQDGPEPTRAERVPSGSFPTTGARGLLDRLRSVEFSLEADRYLLCLLEEAGEKGAALGPERGRRRPVRSPEAAEEERHPASSFAELAADGLPEVRKRIADAVGRRHRVLEEMAASGCFEGRWVGDGERAVYLERTAEPDAQAHEGDDGGPRYEVHRAPWVWVEDAPPGEDPRETLRRGEILARSWASRREFCFLLAVPSLVAFIGHPLLPPVFLLALLAAVVLPLLFYLRHGRRRLLDTLAGGDDARRRKAEEIAALAQLELARRGVSDGPTLDELTPQIARKLRWKRSVSGRGETVLGTPSGIRTAGNLAARPYAAQVIPADADASSEGPGAGHGTGSPPRLAARVPAPP